jgi:uncharacterized membrane protein
MTQNNNHQKQINQDKGRKLAEWIRLLAVLFRLLIVLGLFLLIFLIFILIFTSLFSIWILLLPLLLILLGIGLARLEYHLHGRLYSIEYQAMNNVKEDRPS